MAGTTRSEFHSRARKTSGALRVHTEDCVIYRATPQRGGYRVVTATTTSDEEGFTVFPEMDRLVAETRDVLVRSGIAWSEEVDDEGHPFLVFEGGPGRRRILKLAMEVLSRIGVRNSARIEPTEGTRELYEEVADEHGKEAYLGDQVYICPDGSLRGEVRPA